MHSVKKTRFNHTHIVDFACMILKHEAENTFYFQFQETLLYCTEIVRRVKFYISAMLF